MAEAPKDLKSRLEANNLTAEDVKYLLALVPEGSAEEGGRTIAGRPVVATLPGGMDVIK